MLIALASEGPGFDRQNRPPHPGPPSIGQSAVTLPLDLGPAGCQVAEDCAPTVLAVVYFLVSPFHSRTLYANLGSGAVLCGSVAAGKISSGPLSR